MSEYYALDYWDCDECGGEHPPTTPFQIRYFGDDQEKMLCSDCYDDYQQNKI